MAADDVREVCAGGTGMGTNKQREALPLLLPFTSYGHRCFVGREGRAVSGSQSGDLKGPLARGDLYLFAKPVLRQLRRGCLTSLLLYSPFFQFL